MTAGLRLVPVTLAEARRFVADVHRHNRPPVGWRFGVGLQNGGTDLVGVAVASRPVARVLDDGVTVEITRVCTDGTRNANSMLYGAVCRAAKALGFTQAITYTLDSESGSSLKAVGFTEVARLPGTGDWNTVGELALLRQPLLFGDRYPQHDGEKIRWSRQL